MFDRFKAGDKCKAKLLLADDVKIRDISVGGILLETTKRLNINSRYKIQIDGKLGNEKIMPLGIVVRESMKGTVKKKFDNVPVYHVALKFVALTTEEEAFLNKLISELK